MSKKSDLIREFWGSTPNHPDARWLVDNVLAMDARSQDRDFAMPDALAALPIDADSLVWVGTQRGRLAVEHLAQAGMLQGLPRSWRTALELMGAGAYLDGFVLGTAYGRKLTREGR